LTILLLAQPLVARAQSSDPLEFQFGAAVSHDSNVFRLPDSVDPRAVGRESRSETTSSGYVGFRLDKAYSLQRFQLAVTHTAYRHDNHEELDFDALTYRGAWIWQLTSRLSGVLGADHTEAAVPFSDFQGTQRNVRTADNRTFAMEARLFAGWHLVLGAGTAKQTNVLPVAAEADFESEREEVGLKYLLASGSSLALLARRNDGDYLNRTFVSGGVIDEGFREDQIEAQVSWIATGRSTFTGRLTKLDRTHPNLSQRDFSARAWNVAYNWIVTGKLQLNLIMQRDVSASLDPLTPYTRRDSISLAPIWQATARTVVRPRLGTIRTQYVSVAPSGPGREDDTDLAEVGISWAPTRNVAFDATLLRERRSSNQAGFDYRATVGRIGASFVF
jgi:exopolysaccharide biosynthesis operon protein EpsL